MPGTKATVEDLRRVRAGGAPLIDDGTPPVRAAPPDICGAPRGTFEHGAPEGLPVLAPAGARLSAAAT